MDWIYAILIVSFSGVIMLLVAMLLHETRTSTQVANGESVELESIKGHFRADLGDGRQEQQRLRSIDGAR